MKNVGKRLREERKRCGLTQQALALIGGVRANAQIKYESGERLPRADYLMQLNAILDINFIITGRRNPANILPLSDEESEMVRCFGRLSFNDRAAMEHVIGALMKNKSVLLEK